MKKPIYKIGQKVWRIQNGKAVCEEITGIICAKKEVEYFTKVEDYPGRVRERYGYSKEELFATKIDLLNSL